MKSKLEVLEVIDMYAPCNPHYSRIEKMPTTMSVPMMARLLNGKFPNNGFSWDSVSYFKYEDGTWQPYNEYGEILPTCGFTIKVDVEKI